MADIEKVIIGLEYCKADTCNSKCPYKMEIGCVERLSSDALELLKEQKAEISFLKGAQLQMMHNMSDEDIGNAVAKVLGFRGR